MDFADSSHIRALGEDIVNSYLISESAGVTIVDAGVPGYWSLVPGALADMGKTVDDVRAILLTHGHSDHIGFAERARRERGWPVSVHELDAALARGEIPNPAKGAGTSTRIAPLLRFLIFSARRGALRQMHLGVVSTFGNGATLDVPGAPRVIHVPGHTPGSAALFLEADKTLFVGDAIATYAVTNGVSGPQIAPFGADRAEALNSLARLEDLDATYVLPGHGPAWTHGIGAAVAEVRKRYEATVKV
ncbi:MAG TPA: MBL fold metallo-hydrolase [Candidatus Limnocylindrales bacterium]|jgi:glyoxylase-like metal-dependent hydrolase (beta-lactamase superfamily II)